MSSIPTIIINNTNSSSYAYTTCNPISCQPPASGSWKYYLFKCGSSSMTIEMEDLPSTIYICVAAPGGNGVTNGGGGGGGNIVGYQMTDITSLTIMLEPIGGQSNCIFYTGTGETEFVLNTGGDARSNGGGNGGGSLEPCNIPSANMYTTGLGGFGTTSNNSGSPSPSTNGTVSIPFTDGTSGNVVSSGKAGSSGNASWALVYWQTSL